MSLCGRLSVLFTGLAIAVALGVSLWTGTSHSLKLAGGIVFFVAIAGGLELFFPTTGPSNSSGRAS